MKVTVNLKWLFISISCVYFAFTLFRILATFHLQDFAVYYQAVQLFVKGQNSYASTLDFNYPPTALFFFLPFGLFPFVFAEKVWTVGSVVAFVVSIYLLCKLASQKFYWLDFLLLVSFSILAFPLKFTLGLGQVNLFILLFLSLNIYFYLKQKQYASGVMLGLSIAIKITPLILLVYFFKKKDGQKVLLSCIITLFIVFLTSYLISGDLVFQYFFKILPNVPSATNSIYYNQSLLGFFARLHLDEAGRLFNFFIFGLLLILSYLFTKKSKRSPQKEIVEYSLFLVTILIGGGFSWQHHFVTLIIPFVAVWYFLKKITNSLEKYKLLFMVLVSYVLVVINIKNPQGFSGISTLALSHVLYGSVILWFILRKFTIHE